MPSASHHWLLRDEHCRQGHHQGEDGCQAEDASRAIGIYKSPTEVGTGNAPHCCGRPAEGLQGACCALQCREGLLVAYGGGRGVRGRRMKGGKRDGS